jgi:hypothetical protein
MDKAANTPGPSRDVRLRSSACEECGRSIGPIKGIVAFILLPDFGNSASGQIIVPKTFLTRRQVAELFPISEHTLAKLASAGAGPRYYKPTDKVLYRPEDVEAWIEASAVMPSAMSKLEGVSAKALVAQTKPARGRGRHKRLPTFAERAPMADGRKSLPPSPRSILLRKE